MPRPDDPARLRPRPRRRSACGPASPGSLAWDVLACLGLAVRFLVAPPKRPGRAIRLSGPVRAAETN